jgi:hypothetical protein
MAVNTGGRKPTGHENNTRIDSRSFLDKLEEFSKFYCWGFYCWLRVNNGSTLK